jgi:hypothetical protein
MDDKKTHAFTLKLDEELFVKIEEARGDSVRADYIREILEAYFEELYDNPDENRGVLKGRINNLTSENNNLKNDLNNRDQIIEVLKGQVKDLQQTNGFFINQIQLLSDQKRLSEPKKRLWWEFWKLQ